MPTQYTQQELEALLGEIETKFSADLAKSEDSTVATLAKAEEEQKAPDANEEKEDEKQEKPQAEKASAEAEKADGEEKEAEGEEEEADAEGKKADAEGEEAPNADGEEKSPDANPEDCDYDDEDHAHLADMYSSMSHGELKAHHDHVRKALDTKGMQKCGDMAMAKSETVKAVEVSPDLIVASKEVEILKSELQTKKTEVEELQKNMAVLKEFVGKIFDKKKAPEGKAITNLEVIAKSDIGQEAKVLSKSEIHTKLKEITAKPTLAKSDRDAVTQYYNGGQVNVESISHLLK